jgi:hypothetical protein
MGMEIRGSSRTPPGSGRNRRQAGVDSLAWRSALSAAGAPRALQGAADQARFGLLPAAEGQPGAQRPIDGRFGGSAVGTGSRAQPGRGGLEGVLRPAPGQGARQAKGGGGDHGSVPGDDRRACRQGRSFGRRLFGCAGRHEQAASGRPAVRRARVRAADPCPSRSSRDGTKSKASGRGLRSRSDLPPGHPARRMWLQDRRQVSWLAGPHRSPTFPVAQWPCLEIDSPLTVTGVARD